MLLFKQEIFKQNMLCMHLSSLGNAVIYTIQFSYLP